MRAWMTAALATLSLVQSVLACQPVKRDFLPEGSLGFSENPLVEGRARFDYDPCTQETDVRIRIDGLVPGSTYGVLWLSDGPHLDDPLAFTADSCGEARYDNFQVGDASIDPVIVIYADDNEDGLYTPGEERAISYLPFTRIREFDAAGAGQADNPCVDGMATLRYDRDASETSIHLVMHDLRPNTTYSVNWTSEEGPENNLMNAFTTNRRGTGRLDEVVLGIATRQAVVTIFIDTNSSGVYEPGEELAVGSVQQ